MVYGSIFSFKGMLGLPININTKEIFKKADKVENRRNYAKFKKIVDSFIDPKIKINKIRMREIEKEIISKYNSSVYLINDTYPSQIDYENAINSVNLVLDKYPKFKTGFEILPYTKVQIDENNKDAIYILKYDKLKLLWVLDLKDDEIYSKYEKYIYSIKNELIGKFKNTNLLLDIQDDYVRKIDVYLLKK